VVELTKKYKILVVTTRYWKPRENYLEEIAKNLEHSIKDGDIVTISEKAISTAMGSILDEKQFNPNKSAKILAKFWMPIVWGYILGVICHLRPKTIRYLRFYPFEEGARHKYVALRYVGILQALMHGSEGGIDGTNLPYSYVSLPLKNPVEIAAEIRDYVKNFLGKNVTVIIVDTDKTYSFRNFHFTPRSTSVKGIWSNGGIIFYVLGRFLKLKKRATPVAATSSQLSLEELLTISEIANRARGSGAGRNVWEMAEKFSVSFSEVTWEMLNSIKHKPIVILECL